ncbi:hypothetical protein ANCCAN_26256 [Ancylostoma caninum]|uniref:Uncharacterized protein n=1 Tax=Ancylostoma caninum TaxID=29170 RepID=A0A368F7C6_ANCCA|nr:hypothetical protein ANCCAN_26256 [Ancylostoma caninum]
MRSNMMLYNGEFRRGARNVLSLSKMGVVEKRGNWLLCAPLQFVLLRHMHVQTWIELNFCQFYAAHGNHVNQYIYRVDAVCSECGGGQCDGQALCRW